MTTDGFIRVHDVTFAKSGLMARLGNIENFAPEDLLHMGPHCEIAKSIGCRVVELPPAEGTCSIQSERFYSVHNPLTCCMGQLSHHLNRINLEYQGSAGAHALMPKTLDTFKWQEELRAMGFVMLPMVWRAGACVVSENRIGCLVKSIDDCSNYSPVSMCYSVKFWVEEVEELETLHTLKSLLPLGQLLYLKMGSHSAAPLRNKVPGAFTSSAICQSLLKVHLDSPNTITPTDGKIHVVYLETELRLCTRRHDGEQIGGRANGRSLRVVVDPWELQLLSEGLNVFGFVWD